MTEADWLAAWRAVPQFSWASGYRVWVALALSLVPAAHSYYREGGSGWLPLLIPPLFVGVLALGFRRGRQQFARNAINDMGGGEIRYELTDEGFGVWTPRASSVVAWSGLADVIERDGAFLVYVSPQQFVLMPQRAFSAPDVARVREVLAERVEKKPLRGVPRANAGRKLLLWVILLIAFLAIWKLLGSDAT